MSDNLHIKNGITIPENEIEITASRAGGPGGQHVNKTSTKITLRWNVKNTSALNEEQKNRVLQNLQTELTHDGDLIIHNNTTRSQQQNKKLTLIKLVQIIKKALYVPKKRIKTKISKETKERIFQTKIHRGKIKKLRNKKINFE